MRMWRFLYLRSDLFRGYDRSTYLLKHQYCERFPENNSCTSAIRSAFRYRALLNTGSLPHTGRSDVDVVRGWRRTRDTYSVRSNLPHDSLGVARCSSLAMPALNLLRARDSFAFVVRKTTGR